MVISGETWAAIASIAQALTVVLAIFGILFAWRQIEFGRRIHREQIAYDAYKGWLALGREFVDMAGPRLDMVTVDGLTVKFLGDVTNGEKYTWLVASMLVSFEEVLRAFPADRVWRRAILYDLVWHAPYFGSSFFKGVGNAPNHLAIYSKALRDLIGEAIRVGHPESVHEVLPRAAE